MSTAANHAASSGPQSDFGNVGLFQAIFDNSMDAVFLTSPDGQIHRANPEACRMLGRTEEEIRLAGREGVMDMADPRMAAALQERARTGKLRAELRARRKDGTFFPVEVSSSMFKDSDGQLRTVIVMRDITQRAQTDAALQESEARFRLTFDQSPIGAAIVGLDYRFVRANEELCHITGYSEAELKALTFPDITHPDDLALDVKQAAQVEAGEINQYSMEKRYIHKQGHAVWVHLSVRIVKDPGGKPLYFVSLIKDISARKKAEAERDRLIQELQTALAEVKTLSGLLPICSYCKKIKDGDGYWSQVEAYIMQHSKASFSHGLCPECFDRMVKQLDGEEKLGPDSGTMPAGN